MTELDILLKMRDTICYNRSCENCKLEFRNHPFNAPCSVCMIDRVQYSHMLTDKVRRYISDYYHELYPDGSLSLPLKAEVTEDDINNIFSRS